MKYVRPSQLGTGTVEPKRSEETLECGASLFSAQAGLPPIAVRPRIRQRREVAVWTDTSAPPKTGLCDRLDLHTRRCLKVSAPPAEPFVLPTFAAARGLTKLNALPTPKSLSAICTIHREYSPCLDLSGGDTFRRQSSPAAFEFASCTNFYSPTGKPAQVRQDALTFSGVASVDQ